MAVADGKILNPYLMVARTTCKTVLKTVVGVSSLFDRLVCLSVAMLLNPRMLEVVNELFDFEA